MENKSEIRKRIADSLDFSASGLINYMAGRRGVRWKTAKKFVQLAPETTIVMWMDGQRDKLKAILGYPD